MNYYFAIINVIFMMSIFSNAKALTIDCSYDHKDRLSKVLYDNKIKINYQYDNVGNITCVETDTKFSLSDAIVIIQTISGVLLDKETLFFDIDGDEQVGFEEAITCLKNISNQN